MSKWPCPDNPNRITRFSPASRAAAASWATARKAWADSGAGRKPSPRANRTAHAKGRRVSVIPKSPGMNPVRNEAVAEREHLDDRAHTDRVAEVIRVDTARQRWTRSGLGCDETGVRITTLQLVADEWVREPGEISAAAHTGDHHVRVLARHLHLLLGLEAHHCLVEKDMVDDRP